MTTKQSATVSREQLKAMMQAAVHFGHRVHKWNPKMRPFIYGKRNGIHIFDLTVTAEYLERALRFLEGLAAEGKTVLLVSTKLQSIPFMNDLAQKTGMPYMTNKWVAGLLTNFATIKQRIKYLKDLKKQQAGGEFDKYTKKEALDFKRMIDKLEATLGGVQDMVKMPEAVFVLDAHRDMIVVREANKMKIPVVAIVDSNADPDPIDYPIPGNDDAVKSIKFFLDMIGNALLTGKKATLAVTPLKAEKAAPAQESAA